MKGRKMPDAHASHPNVTPLIDIVMCLIIFYMLVAKIGVNTGVVEGITVPTSFIGVKIDDMLNTVPVNVQAPAMGGDEPDISVLSPKTGQLEPVRVMELTALLKQFRGENKEFQVIIRADQDLPYKYLEPALLSCAGAEVKSVNFETKTKQTFQPAQ